MSELPDPVFVCRVTTISLFLYWSVRGWFRMGHFIRRLKGMASTSGFSSDEVRRHMRRVAFCATVGDPVNVLLMSVIVLLWTAPRL